VTDDGPGKYPEDFMTRDLWNEAIYRPFERAVLKRLEDGEPSPRYVTIAPPEWVHQMPTHRYRAVIKFERIDDDV